MRCFRPAIWTDASSARYASRSTGGTPAPRSIRVGKTSASSFVPVAAAIFPAATSAGSRNARPPSRSALDPRPRSTLAISSTISAFATGAAGGAGGGAGCAPSPHDTSAGRISVATWPGGPLAAAIASAASRATSSVLFDVRTHFEKLRATVSMSDCSCASYCVW